MSLHVSSTMCSKHVQTYNKHIIKGVHRPTDTTIPLHFDGETVHNSYME